MPVNGNYPGGKLIALTAAIVILVSMFTGCTQEEPYTRYKLANDSKALAVVDRIEKALAKNPCVGDVTRWERRYQFATEPADKSLVDISYRKAGTYGIVATRSVEGPGAIQYDIDDTPVDMVFGDYDASTKRLNLKFCGPNMSG